MEIMDDFLGVTMIIWLCSVAFLIFYQGYFFSVLNKKRLLKKDNPMNQEPVSIIIAARNAQKKLERNLESILNQKYPKFEVIIVNDCSFDNTKEWVEKLQQIHSNIKLVNLELDEKYHKGKKFAITIGIKAATYDTLLFTDADCHPNSEDWIREMVAVKGEKEIVLGFSPHHKKGKWWHFLIHYETLHTAMQYFGYAIRKIPYMGVGRNLMYNKTTFFRYKGFASHQHILSGDDDLFIQEAADNKNVAICVSPNSFVSTDAAQTFRQWIFQKLRHQSTAKVYKTKFKLLLGSFSLAQILFISLGAFLLTFFVSRPLLTYQEFPIWMIILGLILLRYLIHGILFYRPSKHFGYPIAFWLAPIFDVVYTFYILFFGVYNIFHRVKSWNG